MTQTMSRVPRQNDLRATEPLALEAVLDAMPARIALLDARGFIVSVNAAWKLFTRGDGMALHSAEVGRDSDDPCYAMGDGAAAQAALAIRSVLGGQTSEASFEYPCHLPGEQRWFRMTVTPLPARATGGAVVMHVDITAQMVACIEARQLNEQLVSAQALAKIGSWSADLASGVVGCSPEVFQIFETDPLPQQTGFARCLERVSPADRAATRAAFVRSVKEGTGGAREQRLLLSSGVTKIIEERWQVTFTEQGKAISALGTVQDITKRKQAEWTLRQHQALLGMVVRLARIGAWSVDLGCDLVVWSDEICAIHDMPPGTMLSLEEAIAFYAPESVGIVGAATRACAEMGTPFDIEAEIITARGRRIWVRVIGEVIRDEHGSIRQLQGACQDLSERRRAEQATRELAGHLSDTIESLTDGFYTLDRDWRFTHINGKALSMASCGHDQLVSRVLWEAFPLLLGSPFEQSYRRAMHDGVVTTAEAWFAEWNGWYSAKAYPSEAGLTVHVRDVSAERTARRHLELLEASVSQLNDIVVITESVCEDRPDKRILFVNQAFVRATGYLREDVLGKSPSLLYGPLTDPAEVDRMRAASMRREAVRAEALIYRSNGESFWAELEVVPVEVGGESSEHFVVIARDITERKQAGQALHELNAELEARVEARTAEANLAREEAERANRAKSAFLATMSHEIRTPMNGVMGMIDVLHQTSLKGYQVEMVDLIRDSADTLMSIVDDILDFSKIEAGKLQIEQVAMQLGDAVEKVCAMLDQVAVKRGVRMTLFVDPAIPRVLAGDETRVRQVLLNLCSNAIKFSSGLGHTGEMSVRVKLLAQDDQGVNVELAVTDNGIGMDEATMARLFTPFSQADGSMTRRFGGTGLGLAITSLLVRLMDGEIGVRSAPGSGSTFSVHLRFARIVHPLNDERTAAAAGLHCRIVGNEQPMSSDLAAYLAHAGAVVDQVPDLASATVAPAPPGLCVWLILPGQQVPDLAALRAMAPHSHVDDSDNAKTRFVVLGRGARRRLRVEDMDLVRLDADAMFRKTLIKALLVAAGRERKAQAVDTMAPVDVMTQAPSRHEARAQGRLILVAEDNETNRLVILRQLALLGYAADVVVNGRDALVHWRSGDYALVLTDLHMPEMDGYALAEAIRAEEMNGLRTPILVLTANAVSDEERRCLAAGADAYLTKPIRLASLRQALDGWLVSRAVGAAAEARLAHAAAGETAVDLRALVALVGDDPLVLSGVLGVFRTSAEQLGQELRREAGAGSRQALVAAAHKMRSGALAIGARQLADVCAAIEQAGSDRHDNTLLPQLHAELQAVLDFLNRTEGSP